MSNPARLIAILINGFLGPLFLLWGLHGFGLHPGYWRCFALTSAFGAELGATLWALPEYLGRKTP